MKGDIIFRKREEDKDLMSMSCSNNNLDNGEGCSSKNLKSHLEKEQGIAFKLEENQQFILEQQNDNLQVKEIVKIDNKNGIYKKAISQHYGDSKANISSFTNISQSNFLQGNRIAKQNGGTFFHTNSKSKYSLHYKDEIKEIHLSQDATCHIKNMQQTNGKIKHQNESHLLPMMRSLTNGIGDSEKYQIPYQLALICATWIFFGFCFLMRHIQERKSLKEEENSFLLNKITSQQNIASYILAILLISFGIIGIIYWKLYLIKNKIRLRESSMKMRVCLMSWFLFCQVCLMEAFELKQNIADCWVISSSIVQMNYIQSISHQKLLNFIYIALSNLYLIIRFQFIVKWEWQSLMYSILVCAVTSFHQEKLQAETHNQTKKIISTNQKAKRLSSHYQDILGVLPEGIAIFDKHKNLNFCNRTIKDLFQCKNSDLSNIILNLSTNQQNNNKNIHNNNDNIKNESKIINSSFKNVNGLKNLTSSQNTSNITHKKSLTPNIVQFKQNSTNLQDLNYGGEIGENKQNTMKNESSMKQVPSKNNFTNPSSHQNFINHSQTINSILSEYNIQNIVKEKQIHFKNQPGLFEGDDGDDKISVDKSSGVRQELNVRNNSGAGLNSKKSIYTPSFKLAESQANNLGESFKVKNLHLNLMKMTSANEENRVSNVEFREPNDRILEDDELQQELEKNQINNSNVAKSFKPQQSFVRNHTFSKFQSQESTILPANHQYCQNRPSNQIKDESQAKKQQNSILVNKLPPSLINEKKQLQIDSSDQQKIEIFSPLNNLSHYSGSGFFGPEDTTKRRLIERPDCDKSQREMNEGNDEINQGNSYNNFNSQINLNQLNANSVINNNKQSNNLISTTMNVNTIDLVPIKTFQNTKDQNDSHLNFTKKSSIRKKSFQISEKKDEKQENEQDEEEEDEEEEEKIPHDEDESDIDYFKNLQYSDDEGGERRKSHKIMKKRLVNAKKGNEIIQRETKVSDILGDLIHFSRIEQSSNHTPEQTSNQNQYLNSNHNISPSINQVQNIPPTPSSVKKNELKKSKTFFSQMGKSTNLGYLQFQEDMIKVQVKWGDQIFVLKFLLLELETDQSVSEDFILVLVDPLWQEYYNKRMQEVERYKMKMFASLSHELRTPLNCTISMLEGLEQYITDPNLIDDYLYPALHSQKLLLNQINDILDFAQIDSGKFKYTYVDFELDKLLQDCSTLIQMQANVKSIDLSTHFDPRLCLQVKSDPNRIRQILLNFLSNSLKFTPELGFIKIVAEPVFVEQTNDLQKYIKLSVIDSGLGMKPETLQNIFNAFNKTEYEKEGINDQGCGLGLAISQSISKGLCVFNNYDDFVIDKNLTGIQVESVYQKGSTFSFILQDMQPRELIEQQLVSESQNTVSQIEIENDEHNFPNYHNNEQYEHNSSTHNSSCCVESQAYGNLQYLQYPQNTQRGHFIHSLTSKKNVNQSEIDDYQPDNDNPLQQNFLDQLSKQISAQNTVMPLIAEKGLGNNSTSIGYFTNNKQISQLAQVCPSNFTTPTPIIPATILSNAQIASVPQSSTPGFSQSSQQTPSSSSNTNRFNHIGGSIGFSQIPSSASNPSLPSKIMPSSTKFTTNNLSREITIKSFSKMISAQGFNGYHSKNIKTEELNTKLVANLQTFLESQQCEFKCSPVLIVDDNQFNILALSRVLQHFFSTSIDKAFDGKQAYDKVVQRYSDDSSKKCMKCKKYEVIFMDIEMPIMTGYEVMKELHLFFKQTQPISLPYIVACTAHGGDQEQVRARMNGFDDYISKPIMKADLQKLLCDWYYDTHYSLSQICINQSPQSQQIVQQSQLQSKNMSNQCSIIIEK